MRAMSKRIPLCNQKGNLWTYPIRTFYYPTKHIKVAYKRFDRPLLEHRIENDYSLKELILRDAFCDENPRSSNRDLLPLLGPKFNRRFQAANYYLWIATLPSWLGWRLRQPGWRFRQYDNTLVEQAHRALPLILEAAADNLHNIVPLIISYNKSPQELRQLLGKGLWRQLSHNSFSRNLAFVHVRNRAASTGHNLDLKDLLDIPTRILTLMETSPYGLKAARLVPGTAKAADYMSVCRIIEDTIMMLGPRFNFNWSLSRIHEEHDKAAQEALERRYNTTPFAPSFVYEDAGFKAELLCSELDIAMEGKTQHHCVAAYAKQASCGTYAVFKITGAERATAGIAKTSVYENWLLQQVYGVCNRFVSDKCKAFTHKLTTAWRKHKTEERIKCQT